MGTYAGIFKKTGSAIPENKRNEFAEKIEKIFRAGGMMDIEWVQLYGKKIKMLRKVRMQEDGMDFYYNYFEDDFWENAGFDKKNSCVWSNKIGWSHFHQVVVAAYVLEEIYTEGVSIAMVDNDPVTSWRYVGWINYLFDEKNHVKNFDPWELFEAVHYSEESEEYMRWYDFGDSRYAFIGGCEIYAVLNGYEKAISVYSAKDKGELEELALMAMQGVVEKLSDYRDNCEKDNESQLQILIEAFHAYYETDKEKDDSVYVKDEMINRILVALSVSDAPAFAVKVISEIYEVEFWSLWEQIRDVAKRKRVSLYGNDGYYVLPISTENFFGHSSDDMLLYWEEVDDNYYHIFAFSDFFEESLENLRDKRYQVLWRMFDNMIHDPEMEKAGDVVFVPDGPEHEKEGLHYLGEQPKRRLIRSWDIMELSKRNNKARVTFRRYMALMANKDLRCKVFGF